MSTITSANSVFTLSIPDVFPSPQQLQGYAADDAFSVEDVEPAEALMGVDGLMSAGYTPFITKVKFVLMADSPSISVINEWLSQMQSAQEVYFADATIDLPSVGLTYTLTKGALTGGHIVPDAKKILQPVSYTLSFESVSSGPLST